MEKQVHILLFYQFVEMEDPAQWCSDHLAFCKELGIKGRILVAEEGLNGSVSGTQAQIEAYKSALRSDSKFSHITFKEELGTHHPFNRMIVKVKPEIIRMDKKLDMNKRGKNLAPQEFLKVCQEEDVILLDTRNLYESKVGKFKNAVTADINNFREFPDFVKKLEDKKDKKIVMYCTGGIRCEKASAYMIEQGFKDVSQLEGGIITFCQQFPNTLWEGSCFVFDKRMTSRIEQVENPISSCMHCNTPCDLCGDCNNPKCNKWTCICPACATIMHACCSKECKEAILSCVPQLC